MNINVTSTMKYINLEGLSTAQIIQKYDELLFQRENIINQLSIQLNESQGKYIEISEKINSLTSRNKELNENKIKCDKALNQQRTDKDLLFIKLNNLMNENDKLKNIISGKKEFIPQQINSNIKEKNNEIKKIKKENKLYESLKPDINIKEQKNNNNINNNIIKKKNESPKKKENIDNTKKNLIIEKKEEKDVLKNNEIKKNEIINTKQEKNDEIILNKENKEKINEEKQGEKKEEQNNDSKKEEKKEDNQINDDKINEEKNLNKNELKNEEKKEEEKKEENNENKIVENDEEKKESNSEKKVIVINPDDYLNRKKKKKKHGKGSGKKLLSEKISYEPVFK